MTPFGLSFGAAPRPRSGPLSPKERYREIAEMVGAALLAQPGAPIHVDDASVDAMVIVLEGAEKRQFSHWDGSIA